MRNLILILPCLLLASCNKYLDKKSDKKLVIPQQLSDLQALLDNISRMNNNASFLGEACADNYYITSVDYHALSTENNKQIYTWGPQPFIGTSPSSHDWARLYNTVYNANVVLDEIESMERNSGNQQQWDELQASALFFRGKAFFEILTLWAPPYTTEAAKQMGIPLRLNSDFNEKSVRSSLQKSIDQSLHDLQGALVHLPKQVNYVSRPSRAAGYGMLARVYLYMADYNKALLYADSCLQLQSDLLDYNQLNAAASYPIPASIRGNNPEVIFHNYVSGNFSVTSSPRAKMDSLLMASYQANDLRKAVYFSKSSSGPYTFKGSYNGNGFVFTGLVTDELYLIKAECEARLGITAASVETLNKLLITRWKTGTYVPFSAATPEIALNIVLEERRKELVFRALRWQDIKRLNQQGSNINLARLIDGQRIELGAFSPRFALPIPEDVIQASGMQQNER